MRDITYRQALLGIGLISLVTLLFELVVNKALGFSLWGQLGFMIIGSAIFGFSIAGVVIAIWKPHQKYRLSRLMGYAAFIFSLSVVLCYVVMNVVPFGFGRMYSEPVTQILFFTIWYLALLIPFSMSGFIIALLLTSFQERANRLYAADLVGAAFGCMIVVPLFPFLGAAGLYLLCAAIGTLCVIIFAFGSSNRRRVMLGASIVAVIFVVASLFAGAFYPVKTHDIKRKRGEDFAAGHIRHSLWSFLSKIEVALPPGPKGMLWFDGGVMQSNLDRFDGDYEKAKTTTQVTGPNALPYRIKPRQNVLIIAPAGGREVRAALTWDAQKVTGVELDSSVVTLVQRELNDYLGGIFRDPRVTLVNDEGRSFVRRSSEKYDTIQFISAFSADAVQSGAVDFSSSYLISIEAFDDYLDHLTPDGVLAISWQRDLRLLFTAWHVLEKRGLNPADRIVFVGNDDSTLTHNTILIKLEPFTPAELKIIKEISLNRLPIHYAPAVLMAEVDQTPGLVSLPKTRRLIAEFTEVRPENREKFYATFPYRVWPVTDDAPFFDKRRYFMRDMMEKPDRVTEELESYASKKEYIPLLPMDVVAQIAILIEAGVLAALFLIFPLWLFKSDGIQTRPQRLSLLYFLSLGLGFIWIEVVLLKKFVLFLGNPVYSIAVVLFAMLIFAGLGSLVSEKLRGELRQKLLFIVSVLTALIIAVIFFYPSLFHAFIGFSFPWRILVAVGLISPVGFILGMPFPLGLKFLSQSSPETVPWAWAMNGYATVVGISTASLIAVQTGFALLLGLSLVVYILGFLCLYASQRGWMPAPLAKTVVAGELESKGVRIGG